MGGMGSGRHWYFNAKHTTDDYRSIDIRCWNRYGLLKTNNSFMWQWSHNGEVVASIRVRTESSRVILTYRHRRDCEDWNDESYPVYLDWSSCNFGGRRHWFLCPAQGCSRRVAILYSGGIFACRHCHRLAYKSQREALHDRAARRANSIRKKLGWEPGVFSDDGCKPKGMHWRTYAKLTAEQDDFVQTSLAGILSCLNLPS
jgi:hypothetical protein